MLHELSMNSVIFVSTEQIPNTILFHLSHKITHQETTYIWVYPIKNSYA